VIIDLKYGNLLLDVGSECQMAPSICFQYFTVYEIHKDRKKFLLKLLVIKSADCQQRLDREDLSHRGHVNVSHVCAEIDQPEAPANDGRMHYLFKKEIDLSE
jgi:hypothetical protein